MRKDKYKKELIEEFINKSTSWAQVCRHFDIKPAGGTQSYIKKMAIKYSLDFSHFTGQNWNLGRSSINKKDALESCKKDTFVQSHNLKERLIRDGYKKAACEKCGISKWLNEPVVLELDHKDSDHYNNEFSNLQILCPNCHALETRKRRKERAKCSTVKKYNESKVEHGRKRISILQSTGIDGRTLIKDRLNTRKVERPTLPTLEKDVDSLGYSATGRKYGVSDNTIRKWIKWYKRN